MKMNKLFQVLTGLPDTASAKPERRNFGGKYDYAFVLSGYVAEYYEIGPKKKKVMAMLFEEGEMLFKSHHSSHFEKINDARMLFFEEGAVKDIIRQSPIYAHNFHDVQEKYARKVEERILVHQDYSPLRRFMHLLDTTAWAFDELPPVEIASYLAVPVEFVVDQIKWALHFDYEENHEE